MKPTHPQLAIVARRFIDQVQAAVLATEATRDAIPENKDLTEKAEGDPLVIAACHALARRLGAGVKSIAVGWHCADVDIKLNPNRLGTLSGVQLPELKKYHQERTGDEKRKLCDKITALNRLITPRGCASFVSYCRLRWSPATTKDVMSNNEFTQIYRDYIATKIETTCKV